MIAGTMTTRTKTATTTGVALQAAQLQMRNYIRMFCNLNDFQLGS
jgi:hypothetical protein